MPAASRLKSPQLAPHRIPSAWQGANSLSDANKLLIRCAWEGTSAFAFAGYGSNWGPGTCPATFTDKAALKTAVQAYNVDPTAAIATYGLLATWDVSAVTDMSYLFYYLQNFNADVSNWDTSSVTDMRYMFQVRSSPCPAPNLQTSPPLCTLLRALRSPATSRLPARTSSRTVCPPFDSRQYASAFN